MPTPNPKQTYKGVLIGFGIQRSIGKTTTYRLRRGNGHYGSKLGVRYQDKYNYFVPASITNVEGAESRICFANAVAAWQGLSDAEKNTFNNLAHHYKALTGFNIFIKRYMETNYS